jgi:hypothetical protein
MRRKLTTKKKAVGAVGKIQHTKKRRRRRRMGGIGAIHPTHIIEKVGGMVGGAVAARQLNAIAVKIVPNLSPVVSGIAQAAIGYMLPKYWKGNLGQAVGNGMITNGGMVAAVSLAPNLLAGIDGIGASSTMRYSVGRPAPYVQSVNGNSPRYIQSVNGGLNGVGDAGEENRPRRMMAHFA